MTCLLLTVLLSAPPAPPVTSLAVAPDGKSCLAGSQAGLEALSYPELKPWRRLATELVGIHDLAFARQGTMLAAAGGIPGKRGTVEFYRWPEGDLLARASPHRDTIYAVAWKTDAKRVLTASADRSAQLLALEGHSVHSLGTLEGHSRGVLAGLFLPGDALALTAGVDESLRLWDIASKKPVRTLANHTRPVLGLALRPNSTKEEAPVMVASISEDRTVRFWQPTLGRMVRFARLESIPLALAWTPDGRAVVAACKDGRLRSLDPDSAEVLATVPALDGVACSLAVAPDGFVLVGGQNGQIARISFERLGIQPKP